MIVVTARRPVGTTGGAVSKIKLVRDATVLTEYVAHTAVECAYCVDGKT